MLTVIERLLARSRLVDTNPANFIEAFLLVNFRIADNPGAGRFGLCRCFLTMSSSEEGLVRSDWSQSLSPALVFTQHCVSQGPGPPRL